MGRKKKKAQNIETHLKAVSVEQLTRHIEGSLSIPDPEEPLDIESLASDWAGPSPPHIVDGTCCEERKKIKDEERRKKDENTE